MICRACFLWTQCHVGDFDIHFARAGCKMLCRGERSVRINGPKKGAGKEVSNGGYWKTRLQRLDSRKSLGKRYFSGIYDRGKGYGRWGCRKCRLATRYIGSLFQFWDYRENWEAACNDFWGSWDLHVAFRKEGVWSEVIGHNRIDVCQKRICSRPRTVGVAALIWTCYRMRNLWGKYHGYFANRSRRRFNDWRPRK